MSHYTTHLTTAGHNWTNSAKPKERKKKTQKPQHLSSLTQPLAPPNTTPVILPIVTLRCVLLFLVCT